MARIKMKGCEWKYHDDEDCWGTSCEEAFVIIDGTPKENRMRYCPYCGREIEEAEQDSLSCPHGYEDWDDCPVCNH